MLHYNEQYFIKTTVTTIAICNLRTLTQQNRKTTIINKTKTHEAKS